MTAEVKLELDEYGGNTRNTDVLAYGTADGGRVVEAKADEPFDPRTVEAAATDPKLPQNSNLRDRAQRLCERLFGEPLISDGEPNDRFREVRYQLVHGPVADSDSTGATTGNLLGAMLGAAAIPDRWLEQLELRDEIEEIADDLRRHFEAPRFDSGHDELERYPGW